MRLHLVFMSRHIDNDQRTPRKFRVPFFIRILPVYQETAMAVKAAKVGAEATARVVNEVIELPQTIQKAGTVAEQAIHDLGDRVDPDRNGVGQAVRAFNENRPINAFGEQTRQTTAQLTEAVGTPVAEVVIAAGKAVKPVVETVATGAQRFSTRVQKDKEVIGGGLRGAWRRLRLGKNRQRLIS